MKYVYMLIVYVLTSCASGATFFVSEGGSDLGSGSLEEPLASLAEAVQRMSSGDICYVRAGRYREELSLSGRDDLTFQAYANETVVMDGTVELDTDWSLHSGSIFKTPVDESFWQLFADELFMMPARWPNASLEDLSVWNQQDTWAKVVYSTSKTDFTDQPTSHSDLQALGFSVQGAIAVMNVGSFKSYAREILSHQAGSANFTVGAVGNRKAANYQYYFLEGALELLDAAGEWYLDVDNNMLYAWGDTNATWRGKTQDYAFQFTNCDDITIKGIDFFGTTVSFNNCERAHVEGGTFLFPSCTKRMLGIASTEPDMTEFNGGGNSLFYDNIVRFADTPAIYMNGVNNRIENCLFEYIDWSAADLPSLMMTVYMRGTGSDFIGNSAHTTGASAFLDVNNAVRAFSNEVWNTGLVQNDGSVIQLTIGAQPNSETAYNWFFDTEKYGARFDASTSPGSPTGSDGLMHHNVGFNVNATIMQKGDQHRCINNTSFDTVNNGIIILSDNVSTNVGTVIRNNVADRMGSHRKNNVALTEVMDHSHNWNGYEYGSADVRTVLRDVDHLDFRPKPHSILIDSGKEEGVVTAGYIGAAPDLGAYESGDLFYWIPGRKEAAATRPVPPHQATGVKESAALMWRKGLSSQESHLYVGTSSNEVSAADETSPLFKGSYTNNLYDPLGFSATTYYWRVDEVTSSGVERGPIWSFEVAEAEEAAPTLTTSTPDVATDSATISGVLQGSVSSQVQMEWWRDSGTTNTANLGIQAGEFETTLVGLETEQQYYYRLAASNQFGSVWTTIHSFETGEGSSEETEEAAILFKDLFEASELNQSPSSDKWSVQTTLNEGEIQVLQQSNRVVGRLYNPTTNPDGARTVLSAVDVLTNAPFITVSFDSFFEGDVTPSGSFFLGAGIGSLASHHNQIRKVNMRTHGMLDTWNHFDWLVNQTGSNVVYEVGGSAYTLPTGHFDLWRDGILLIANSNEKSSSAQNIPLTDVTPITSIGFTANKADQVDWRIDSLVVRDAAYVESMLSAYRSWEVIHDVQGSTNDWDGDGLLNIMEYGVGTAPRNALDGPQRLPVLQQESDEMNFIYHRRTLESDDSVAFIVETATNLSANNWQLWSENPAGMEAVDADIVRVTNAISTSNDMQFFRLRMEWNETAE